MKHTKTQQLTMASILLALGILLPFFTMQIPEIGNKLLPMHLPILLCGFILNWKYGLFIGFVTPILRSLLFSMPPLFPTAFAMSFELATYGVVVSLLYHHSSKNLRSIYLSLLSGMVLGRLVWGLVMLLLMSVTHDAFTFSIFYASVVLNAIPGILLQLILLPIIIKSLQSFKVISK